MVKRKITRKSLTKNIRFPHWLTEQIVQALADEGSKNFSAWVIDACGRKLKAEQRNKPKEAPKD